MGAWTLDDWMIVGIEKDGITCCLHICAPAEQHFLCPRHLKRIFGCEQQLGCRGSLHMLRDQKEEVPFAPAQNVQKKNTKAPCHAQITSCPLPPKLQNLSPSYLPSSALTRLQATIFGLGPSTAYAARQKHRSSFPPSLPSSDQSWKSRTRQSCSR